MLHEFENNIESQNHLKDNGEKFNRQCVMVLQVLYRGGRWTGKMINDLLDIADGGRRLRNLYEARKEVKREWVMTEDGKKTKWKEYWLEIPKQPTKKELIVKVHESNSKTPVIAINRNEYIQKDLFK